METTKKIVTMSNLAKNNLNLISFKNGCQLASIGDIKYQFDFTEDELIDSILAYTTPYDLERRSGLDRDDYTNREMAVIVAQEWDESDVLVMIADLPTNELSDYVVAPAAREEHSHAA